MDSLKRATELQTLAKMLEWSIREVKGVDKDGKRLSFCSSRRLELRNVTELVTHPQSSHPINFRLTAQFRNTSHNIVSLNDSNFLDALAKAISSKLPDLLDEALEIVKEQGREAVKTAEKELESSTKKLAALRRSPELQQELL